MAAQFLDSNVITSNAANVAAFNTWLAAHTAAYDIPKSAAMDLAKVEAEEVAWDQWLRLTEQAGIASPGQQLNLL